VQGNLDPQLLAAGGPALHAETDRILRALSAGPFVFNLGHGIVKTTPPEHVTALAEQVRAWTTPAPARRRTAAACRGRQRCDHHRLDRKERDRDQARAGAVGR